MLVASAQYHGSEALTYSSDVELPPGSVVRVPLQRQAVLGVVTARVPAPRFPTKPISERFDLPPLPAALPELATWLHTYYPAPLGVTIQQILPALLSAKTIAETEGVPPGVPVHTDVLPAPTGEQAAVLQAIDTPDTYLLHGDTGSGKTRVYIELAPRTVAARSSVILLTPEIGLTSQLAASFREVFGERVVLVHSRLTPKASPADLAANPEKHRAGHRARTAFCAFCTHRPRRPDRR